jgi:hypothetical protein
LSTKLLRETAKQWNSSWREKPRAGQPRGALESNVTAAKRHYRKVGDWPLCNGAVFTVQLTVCRRPVEVVVGTGTLTTLLPLRHPLDLFGVSLNIP